MRTRIRTCGIDGANLHVDSSGRMARKDYNRWQRERRVLGYRLDSPGDPWNDELLRERAVRQHAEQVHDALRARRSLSIPAEERVRRVETVLRRAQRPLGLKLLVDDCELTMQHTLDALTELMEAGTVIRTVARDNAIRFSVARPLTREMRRS